MKHLKEYKLFESSDTEDTREDIKYILLDISDDYYWSVFVKFHDMSCSIYIETSFEDDFINLPTESKESIERLIEYMRSKEFTNYRITKESDTIVLSPNSVDIFESTPIELENIENIDFTSGKFLKIKFWK